MLSSSSSSSSYSQPVDREQQLSISIAESHVPTLPTNHLLSPCFPSRPQSSVMRWHTHTHNTPQKNKSAAVGRKCLCRVCCPALARFGERGNFLLIWRGRGENFNTNAATPSPSPTPTPTLTRSLTYTLFIHSSHRGCTSAVLSCNRLLYTVFCWFVNVRDGMGWGGCVGDGGMDAWVMDEMGW